MMASRNIHAPLRIAFVAPFGLRAKGTARARALPLARALAGRGHSLALFIPPYDSPQDSGRCWRDGDVAVINVALPGKAGERGASGVGAGGLWHMRLAFRLLMAVERWQPDVVHVFKPKGPSGFVGTALWVVRSALGRDRPLIVDSDDWEGAGGWNDDPRAAYTPLQRRTFTWQERYGLTHADAWTVTSACLRDRAVAFGAPPRKVFVLPNGIADLAPWATTGGVPKQPQSALLYTRFAGVRVDQIATIWRRVVELVPDAALTVVGQGLGGEERELAATAPAVHVVGWVEPPAMPALFGRHTVAIVPWADTPPNRARSSAKVLELMAAGLPIVGSAVGELPATLGGSGVLVPAGDTEAFAREVATLLADPQRAAFLGQAARDRLQSCFTWDRLVEIVLAAYRG
jgi:glycosyltransferase involved in cell wall biosynthesis